MSSIPRKLLTLIFSLNIICVGFAQSTKTDSLYDLVSQIEVDSLKLKEIGKLSAAYKRSEPEFSMKLCNEGIELAQKLNADFEKAILLNRLGLISMDYGEYKTSSTLLFQSLAIFDSLNNSHRIASSYNNIGILYKKQGRYEEAMNYYRLSLRTYGETIPDKKKATSLNNFGIVHKHLKQYDSAIFYFNQSIILNKKENSIVGMSNNEVNLANVYKTQQNHELASEHYLSALNLKKELNDKNGVLKVRWNLAASRAANNENFDYQIKELKNVGIEARSEGYKPIYHGVCEDLAFVYELNNNYDSAYKYLKLSQVLKDSLINVEINKQLGELTFARLDVENKGKMAALKERNFAQEALIEKEKSFSQILMTAIMFMVLLVILVVWLLYQNQKNGKKIFLQKEVLKKAKENTDLINSNLKSINKEKEILVGMIAHDLKAPIDQIKGLMELTELDLKDAGKIPHDTEEYIATIHQSIERVYSLISKIVDSQRNKRNLSNLKSIELYDFIESISHNFNVLAKKKSIILVNQVNESCLLELPDPEKTTRIIENLLSNAIKYSFPNQKVIISSSSKNNAISLHIKDGGPGLSAEEIKLLLSSDDISQISSQPSAGEESHGIGLLVVKRFVKELGYELKISSELGAGCTFTVEFK